ncbi:MAG: hypothetical protein ABFD92_19470 [Planctomycetaceae bacterium]|nr:hypothetical protein [Planctomycetaceae bacterium]
MADQSKNGKTGCLIAVILGVIGIGAGIWGGASMFHSGMSVLNDMFAHEYVVPGRHVVDLQKPGVYVVWHEYFARKDGKTYDASPDMEMNISIRHRETGRQVVLQEMGGRSEKIDTPDRKAMAVGTFSIREPGQYLLEVTAEENEGQTVLAIGTAPDEKVLSSVGPACGVLLLAGLALLGALVFGIIAIVRMSTYKRQEPTSPYQMPPPPPPQA